MAAMNRMVVEIFDRAMPLHEKYRGELAEILRKCAVFRRMSEFSVEQGSEKPATVEDSSFLWS